jgi:hypothetical protein
MPIVPPYPRTLRNLPPDIARERNEATIPAPFGVVPSGPGVPQGGQSAPSLAMNQADYKFVQFAVVAAALVQEQQWRRYFLIQNRGANNLLVGFGWVPTTDNALVLLPGQAYEPYVVPINAVYCLGAGAGTFGLIIFGT